MRNRIKWPLAKMSLRQEIAATSLEVPGERMFREMLDGSARLISGWDGGADWRRVMGWEAVPAQLSLTSELRLKLRRAQKPDNGGTTCEPHSQPASPWVVIKACHCCF